MKNETNKISMTLAVAALLAASDSPSFAAGGNWTNDASSSWGVAANWDSNVVPGTSPGDVVSLSNNITAARTITLDTPATVGRLYIGDSVTGFFPFTLSGNSALTFNNSGAGASLVQTLTTASDTNSVAIVLADNLVVTNTSTLVLSGNIDDQGLGKRITKLGAGTLTLMGSNSFGGGMVLSNGTVVVVTNGPAGLLAQSNAFGTGTITLAGGTIRWDTGGVRVTNSIYAQPGTTNTLIQNGAQISAIFSGNITGSGTINANANVNYGGVQLAGDNSGFTGTLNTGAGNAQRFKFNSASAGSANATWVFNSTTTDGQGFAFGTGTIQLGAISGPGYFRNDAAGITTVQIGDLNTDCTFTGTFNHNGNSKTALLKVGTAKLTLTGSSSYTNTTTVQNGVLIASNNVAASANSPFGNTAAAIALGDATTIANNWSPTLIISGPFTNARPVTVGNDSTVTTGVYTMAGNLSYNSGFSGFITLNQNLVVTQATGGTLYLSGGITSAGGAQTVTVNNAGSVVVSTNVSNGSGIIALTKANTGTLTITGGSTYTGDTVVRAGTLALGPLGGITNSSITVSNGAVLDVSAVSGFALQANQNLLGAGLVTGAVTTASSSKIFGGTDGVVGTLSFSNSLTMTADSTFNLDVSTSSSTGNDTVAVAGTLTLNNTALTVNALSGSANLATAADYVLVVAGSIVGSPNSIINWAGTPPNNAGNFSVIKSGSTLRLHYASSVVTPPSVNGVTLSPDTLVRGQKTLITASVTPGSNPLSTVIVNASPVNPALSSYALQSDGSGNYTNSILIANNTAANSYTLGVTATDSQGYSGFLNGYLTVLATNEVWSGSAGDNKWSSGANWVSGLPAASGDTVALAGSAQLTNNFDSSLTLNAVSFNSGAGSFFITSAGSTLTLAGGLTNNSANAQTVDVPLALSGPQTIETAAGNLTLSRGISSSGMSLTKTGNRTLVLTGVSAYGVNPGDYFTIASGALTLGGAGLLGGGDYTSSIDDEGILNFNSSAAQTISGTIYGNGAVNVGGPGTLILSGGNSYASGTTLTNSILSAGNSFALGSGTLAVSGGTLNNTGAGDVSLGNSIVFAGGGTIQLGTGHNLTLSGEISGSGSVALGTDTLYGNSLYLNAANTLTNGTVSVGATANGNYVRFSSSAAGNENVAWVFNNTTSGRTTFDFGGATISFGSLSGNGYLQGNSAGTHTLSVGGANKESTFTGILANGGAGGIIALTKVGSGVLALSGANTYTGPTEVSAGTLKVSSLQTGAGTFAVDDGASLEVSLASAGATLNVSGLTLGTSTGCTNSFTGLSSTTVAAVTNTGALTLNGTVVVNASGFTSVGQYPLIYSAGGITGTGGLVPGALPYGAVASISTNASNDTILLNLTTAPAPVIWSGATDANWNTTTTNWTANGEPVPFVNTYSVQFDDSSARTNVVVATNVSPGTLVVSNTVRQYTFTGAAISGGATLTKNGNGTLILANTNTYSAGTTVNAGLLQLGDGSTRNGVVAGGITDNANLAIANPFDQTLANAITGSGNLAKAGAGALTITSSNTFTGTTTIKQGLVSFSTTNNLSTNSVTLGDTATGADAGLQLAAAINEPNNLTIASGAGTRTLITIGGAIFSGAMALNHNLTLLKTNGNADVHVSSPLSGSGNVTVNNTNGNIVWFDGPGTNWTGSLIIVGNQVRPGTAVNPFTTNTVLSVGVENGAFFNVGGINADLHFAGVNDIAGATGGGFGGGSSAHNVVLGGSGNYTYSGGFSSVPWGLYFDLAGSGKQTLTGTNAYGGGTTINRGTLALSGGGAISNSPNFAIGAGATFDVSGLLSTFGLTAAQTLRNTSVNGPGNIIGNVNLSAGSLLLNYTNGTPALNVAIGTMAFAANPVTVTVSGPQLPAGSFKLISKGAGGSVSGTLPATFTVNGAGTASSNSLQVVSGELYLVVASSLPSTPTNISYSVSGGMLTLSWPADYKGWLAQSNSVDVANTNAWFTVPGSDAATSLTVTIEPAKPNVFYRLHKP